MNTRGFTLVVVLIVAASLSASGIYLYSLTRDDMRIAGNNRRILQSKLAATSGISHFKSMELFYDQLKEQSRITGNDNLEIISETPLGDRTFYKVDVQLCCDLGENEFIVKSTGYYKDNGRIISEHVKHSLFKTVN